jgi:hypothetical protein
MPWIAFMTPVTCLQNNVFSMRISPPWLEKGGTGFQGFHRDPMSIRLKALQGVVLELGAKSLRFTHLKRVAFRRK